MGDDYKIILEAMIDESSLSKAQKQIAKERLKIGADISVENFAKSKHEIEKQMVDLAKGIKTILGDAVSDKQATQWAKQYYDNMISGAKEAQKAQQKLNEEQRKSTLWDANKQRSIAEQEILLQKELQAIYDQTAQKVKSIKFSVDSGNGSSDYANRIEKLKQELQKYGVSSEEASKKTEKLKTILAGFKNDGNWLPDEQIVAQADRIEQEFKAVKVSVDQAKLSFDKFNQPVSEDKKISLINRINSFLTKNTKITDVARQKLQRFIDELNTGVNEKRWKEINGELKTTENSMRGLGKLGASFRNQMKQAAESFTQWLSVSSAIMLLVSKTKQAITELKEVDTLLTEITKANDNLTKSQVSGIGDRSFETASKYGKKATDYLSGVQEMSRAGYYKTAEAMGELSVKAQGAGDMTSEVANKFIVATDKAYKLNGSLIDLTKIMDGINYITNHNAINMTELSEGFSIVGSTAASFGVEANELTAALATMGASTQQSGSEVARAFRAILLNIRQVSDEEEGIDAEGLTKYEEACNDLNVKLKETKNGVQELRNPMEVLRELSNEYKKLSDTDIRKVNLLNAVGGKLRATQLDALLRGWSDYETMLGQFESGLGSMDQEAAKTADSLEGRLNELSNTWTDTVENVANTDAIKAGVSALNDLLSIVDALTGGFAKISSIGGNINSAWGTIGAISGLLMNRNGIGELLFQW